MLKNKFASASELEKQCRAFLQRGMQFQIEITSDGAERTTQILVVGKELCCLSLSTQLKASSDFSITKHVQV